MERYVALLRGIAPDGENMTSDKVRGVFDELGFAAVGSVLASGNNTFSTAEADVLTLEARIEEALVSVLGITSRTIIRESSELRSLVDSDPFPGLTHERRTYLTATFLKDAQRSPGGMAAEPGRSIRVVRYGRSARAVLAVTDNSDPGTASGFMSWLESSCGKDITICSWLTVQRIVRKTRELTRRAAKRRGDAPCDGGQRGRASLDVVTPAGFKRGWGSGRSISPLSSAFSPSMLVSLVPEGHLAGSRVEQPSVLVIRLVR